MISRNLLDERTMSAAPPPADAKGWNQLGIARLSQRDAAGALDAFAEARRLDPNHAEAWNNSGLVRQMLGRLAEAVADFDQALAIRPAYPEALNNRGRALQALGDFAGALADFNRALACAPATFAVSVLHNRAVLRQAQDDLAGALADFDRVLELDPGHAVTYMNRAVARKEAGDLAGALADCEQALTDLPAGKHATVYHLRGGLRILENDFAAARADYDRAIALEPTNYLFHVSRGHARYHQRDPRGLVDYLRAFRLDLERTAREILRFLVEQTRRDAAGVLENCARHLRLNAQDAVAHARRGLTLVLLGRDEEALLDFSCFLDLAPEVWGGFCRVLDLARQYRSTHAVSDKEGVRSHKAAGSP